ncbi:proline racemase family protein [Ancylobacter sp. 6x-1]|uniref:4-hydroxyproline epimerase n=1 Tax=Ancylobacter crimeensis TaxID=2579147 RepID=A0ABT0DA23_9HYPH|nr:trans-3-hydroxy-L-proline dehydratase [Ancylobacter crimeensis]MCK0196744.1 proline racemase family protein [Ancylobacter crimeensis]
MFVDRLVSTVEMHTGGEPFRIITSGIPAIPGASIVARRAWLLEHADVIRRSLTLEPRGHADMYLGILTPPVSPDAQFGVIFAHNEGYSDHCGHGVIALATAAVLLGWVERVSPQTRVVIDAPCGRIEAFVAWDGAKVGGVSFVNVPSFVWQADAEVETPSFGRVRGDIAFGGAFYFYTDGRPFGLDITAGNVEALIRFGDEVKQAANRAYKVVHDEIPELNHIYGTIIDGPPRDAGSLQANCCIFADRQVDRSPTGSGTAGRTAILSARGWLKDGERWTNESLIGTTMSARVLERVRFHGREAVIPEISGTAHFLGTATWALDPDDPIGEGFLVR